MAKPRIVFPFVEAGFGHIMTERAIADAFETKYGEYFEIVRSDFYKESDSEPLRKYEKMLCDNVRYYNRFHIYGYASIAAMNLFGSNIASKYVMEKHVKGAYPDAVAHMRELHPDIVISTHWATAYYAQHIDPKPFNVMYVPDAHANAMFRYPNDLSMISMPEGYKRARRFKKRYNDDNLKLVPLAIRKEAFAVERDKTALRKKLGLKDRFTVYLTEGGYGIGLTEKLCKLLLKEDLPINIVAVCGKNPEMKARLDDLKENSSAKNTEFFPFGFCDNPLELIAASDLYLGKSGNGLMEPSFFGVPIVVTHSANTIEKLLAEHYVSHVKNAVRIFRAKKCVAFIKDAVNGGEKYTTLKNVTPDPARFGAEGIADVIFERLNEVFKVKP